MMPQQKQSPGQALSKIKQYCSYQERCHEEVKQKLSDFGLSQYEIGQILGILIEENFLNEERFAIQFAGGKFRMKHWGKLKIRQELRQRKVSEYCIKIAMILGWVSMLAGRTSILLIIISTGAYAYKSFGKLS